MLDGRISEVGSKVNRQDLKRLDVMFSENFAAIESEGTVEGQTTINNNCPLEVGDGIQAEVKSTRKLDSLQVLITKIASAKCSSCPLQCPAREGIV